MCWAALAAAAATAYESSEEKKAAALGGGGVPASAPVSVSVGGLNVPAFPDFPRINTTYAGFNSGQTNANQLVTDDRILYIAGAVVLVVFILKKVN